MLSVSFFVSSIAKGLAMCTLGGVISAQKFYFEPCLLQVLSTFCILISIINPIGILRSWLCYRSHFVVNFAVFTSYLYQNC